MLYLYAIADARPRGDLGAGMGRAKLEVVRVRGAFVIAQRVASTPVLSRSTVKAHHRVVGRVFSLAPAVLPVRFGTTAEDAAALGALLAPAKDSLARALALVRGCVQYTHRVYAHGKQALAAPEADDASAGPGARWMAKRLHRSRAPEAAPLALATKEWVRAALVERHDRPPLVASVYHLVLREDARRYRAAVSKVRFARGLRLETTGPWPPYAFAELQ